MRTQTNILGIDIGRVIIGPVVDGKADTAFLDGDLAQAMNTPPSPGAFSAIRELVRAFEKRVWLVSKAGKRTQEKTLCWLKHQRFFEYTGLPADQVAFCRYRKAKAAICGELGISHFIDDRVDVLGPMRRQVSNLFLFGEQAPQHLSQANGWTLPVADWNAALDAVLRTLEEKP